MNEHRKSQALQQWDRLFIQPEIRMNAEEHYEALLHLADDFEDRGIINFEERRMLIAKATSQYAQSIEGIGQGT